MRTDATPEETAFYQSLGTRLRRRRVALDYTLSAAGQALGLTWQTLSEIERATRRGNMYTVARYAAFLGLRPVELFGVNFADLVPFVPADPLTIA